MCLQYVRGGRFIGINTAKIASVTYDEFNLIFFMDGDLEIYIPGAENGFNNIQDLGLEAHRIGTEYFK